MRERKYLRFPDNKIHDSEEVKPEYIVPAVIVPYPPSRQEPLLTRYQIHLMQVNEMGGGIETEIAKLTELAKEKGATARRISATDVVVSQWVRFKCRYGCKGYGKHFGCPPYAPSYEETQRMVKEFSTGLLIRFDGVPGHGSFGPDDIPEDFHPFYADLIRLVNGTVHTLEKTAFYDGFYKAFGFGGYPCIWCEHQHCVAEEAEGVVDESLRRKCRHMDLVRPSMEAACMDVFATARNAGWELRTIPCKDMEYGKVVHSDIVSIGLVLIE